jgi:hypothetical protein
MTVRRRPTERFFAEPEATPCSPTGPAALSGTTITGSPHSSSPTTARRPARAASSISAMWGASARVPVICPAMSREDQPCLNSPPVARAGIMAMRLAGSTQWTFCGGSPPPVSHWRTCTCGSMQRHERRGDSDR